MSSSIAGQFGLRMRRKANWLIRARCLSARPKEPGDVRNCDRSDRRQQVGRAVRRAPIEFIFAAQLMPSRERRATFIAIELHERISLLDTATQYDSGTL